MKPLAERLAANITGSRETFARAFATAQESRPATERKDFKLVATTGEDLKDFVLCFELAGRNGWLTSLCTACMQAYVAGDKFLIELQMVQVPPSEGSKKGKTRKAQSTESLYSKRGDFFLPQDLQSQLPLMMEQTCLIYDDAKVAGTGTLIAPDLVLTAWHVVKGEFDATKDYEPRPDAPKRLELEFDRARFSANAETINSIFVKVSPQDWAVAWSRCHDAELVERLPVDLQELANHLDYAVLRLARRMEGRSFRALGTAPALNDRGSFIVCHHPEGSLQRISYGQIAKILSAPRFLHSADTLQGSSGAACLDSKFRILGIHQAGFKESASKKNQFNRGVPAAAFAEKVTAALESSMEPLWRIRSQPAGPVIGTAEFQRAIRRSTLAAPDAADTKRIFVVTGAKGTGKTFHLRLLPAMLPAAENVIVDLNPLQFPATPEALAREILRVCGKPDSEADSLPPLANADTTEDAWLRNQLAPAFDTAARKAVGARRVWLTIDQLDLYQLPEGNTKKFFEVICEQIVTMGWLRIVLAGFSGALPTRVQPSLLEFPINDPTELELNVYLKAHYRAANGSTPPPEYEELLLLAAKNGAAAEPTAGRPPSLIESLEFVIKTRRFLPQLP